MRGYSTLLLTLSLASMTVEAHGPTPQKAKETITINASVDKVWDKVKQFDDISTWHPDVKASKGDGKLESGGTRTVTLQNGGELVDELDFYSAKDHEYSYRLKKENTSALPVSSYSVSLQISPDADASKSVVTLKSRFYRGDTGNSPAESQNDAAAVKAMQAFFTHGLDGLKKQLEH